MRASSLLKNAFHGVFQLASAWRLSAPRIALLASVAAAVGLPPPAKAQQNQNLDAVRAAATRFAETRLRHPGTTLQVSVQALDSRLRLAACDRLQPFFPAGARHLGNTTVGVRCRSPKPWVIYLTARTAAYGKVLVSAHALPRGAVLSASDFRLARRDLAALPYGYLNDPRRIASMILTQPLSADAVLTPGMLQAPHLVHRGQRVTLVTTAPGLEVRMAGQALTDGARGTLVQVRNLASQRVVEGTVVASGVVRVTP